MLLLVRRFCGIENGGIFTIAYTTSYFSVIFMPVFTINLLRKHRIIGQKKESVQPHGAGRRLTLGN